MNPGTQMLKQARQQVTATRRAAPKSTYLLRDVDPALWRLVKGKAALEGITVKVAVERLLQQWVGHR